mmetsp:Transcript_1671/g.2462  ORF Transcript_1671/g.2462 Transcript_1671/m.2462 type:complete len:410 (+) Transcript_1671:113-1342(+)|eukprot:CAMPEP_0194201852 /NCGR_PEP_ID=MMETSP0156-20130528/2017_1 /TAXON_ID=33649 /ORGANISM="Thalassionema nitzschioides, Strain L26-B" /LENGTH=409 /DNA_ID=CAMNT_0038927155 /DNA_START=38 /DNA_END=1270 /DNA_ORIENTATION=-
MKLENPETKRDRGVYDVTESGIKFHHSATEPPATKNSADFLSRFTQDFSMKILDQPSENELVFEMIGVDVSFANALRRILISEIPTMAIETVFMWDNTSIIHDEVLAHRLGLIPINVDARYFEAYDEEDEFAESPDNNGGESGTFGNDEANLIAAQNATDQNTIVFKLAVTCSRSECNASKTGNSTDYDIDDTTLGNAELDEAASATAARKRSAMQTPNRPYTKHIYSRDLEWVPQGDQELHFSAIRPVHEDILIAKLRPGQSIELEAHARKGNGKDHAKYSPVATASFRLMPRIEIMRPIYDDLAEELVHLLEPGVFKLEKVDDDDPPGTRVKASISNPYACTMSRNFMRNEELSKSIKMTRVPNHVIFSIESVGMASPGVLMAEALRILQGKCRRLINISEEKLDDT